MDSFRGKLVWEILDMSKVQIDESIYLLLEKHYLEKYELTAAELEKVTKFFVQKSWARYNRENHVDEWKAQARIKKLLGEE